MEVKEKVLVFQDSTCLWHDAPTQRCRDSETLVVETPSPPRSSAVLGHAQAQQREHGGGLTAALRSLPHPGL